MRSIISNERVCLVCNSPYRLKKHNIFYGNGKEWESQKYGCWCYLCTRHHIAANTGVHFSAAFDLKLKIHTQKRFNEVYPELNFKKIFKVNYL